MIHGGGVAPVPAWIAHAEHHPAAHPQPQPAVPLPVVLFVGIHLHGVRLVLVLVEGPERLRRIGELPPEPHARERRDELGRRRARLLRLRLRGRGLVPVRIDPPGAERHDDHGRGLHRAVVTQLLPVHARQPPDGSAQRFFLRAAGFAFFFAVVRFFAAGFFPFALRLPAATLFPRRTTAAGRLSCHPCNDRLPPSSAAGAIRTR